MKITIVGAGISGLATAYNLLQRNPDLDITVFESNRRIGGKVWTDQTSEGFLCEGGVNGFLDNKPKTLQLSAQLGLNPVASFTASRKRFVFSRGCLRKLPESPPAFLSSDLLSIGGRLRVLAEMLIPRGHKADETLADFAVRRLGREAFETLIDPMASGVFAGDANNMSLKSCFPRIHEIEMEFGSLIRGLIRLQLRARRAGKTDRPSAGPGGTLTSFDHGMGVLTETLASALGSRVRVASPVISVTRSGQGYVLHTEDGTDEETEILILAAPAHAQKGILKEMAPEISALLADIQYPSLTVCCLGFKTKKLNHDLDGFGFLIPSKEQCQTLGTVWDSSVFPERAPQGYALLRTMVGGARASERAMLPDDQLVDLVRKELKQIMGMDVSPDFVRTYRHKQAIPQYQVGHADRLEVIEQKLQGYPGLILTGNAYKGVSLNDCVANADRIAKSLLPT